MSTHAVQRRDLPVPVVLIYDGVELSADWIAPIALNSDCEDGDRPYKLTHYSIHGHRATWHAQ